MTSGHAPRSEYGYEDLLSCARGEMFGRGNAQLPLPPMLMFDRIASISAEGGEHGKGCAVAEMSLTPDLWFFRCHFAGDPIMPGCLGLDALWQLAGFFLGWLGEPGRGRALSAGAIKFSSMITPAAQRIRYRLDVKRIARRRLSMIVADGRVDVDGEPAYVAEDLRVGVFVDP